MAVYIRMKNVTRALLFLASLLVWVVVLSVVNTRYNWDEYVLLGSAVLLGVASTWVIAVTLHT